MKRLLIVLAVAVGASAVIDAIGDATQTRPERVPPGSESEIVLAVQTKGRHGAPGHAAQRLWAACRGTFQRTVLTPAGVDAGEGRVAFRVTPALGARATRRLRGCLQDLTLDHVKGSVVAVKTTATG